MKGLKELGNREIAYLSFPVVFSVFIYFLTVNYVKGLLADKWSLSTTYRVETFVIPSQIKEKKIELSEIKDILTVKPYQVVVKKENSLQKEKPPQYKISFIYIGNSRYAIINGRLLKEGENISKDEKVIKIHKNGILLKGRWGERWIRFLK